MVISVNMITKLRIVTIETILTLETKANISNLSIPCVFRSMYSVYCTKEMLCIHYLLTHVLNYLRTYLLHRAETFLGS